MTHTTLSSDSSRTRRLALAGVFTALAIVGSFLSFPVAGSKCAPVQHIINILAAVTLGPWYSVGIAFCASLLRNLLGLGSMMAFPGSMVGALCCGLVYSICHKLSLTCLAEALGTRNSWRPGCLSCCSIYYGNHSCRDLRLCSSISDFYYCRKHSCISADYSAEQKRRNGNDKNDSLRVV